MKKKDICFGTHRPLSLLKYLMIQFVMSTSLLFSKSYVDMIKNNNLRVFDISTNKINGGSTRFYICHKNSDFKIKKIKLI